MAYSDPLLARAQVLIIENRLLRQERRQMQKERERARKMLQMNLFEAASQRVETVSVREEMRYRRTGHPRSLGGRFRLDS